MRKTKLFIAAALLVLLAGCDTREARFDDWMPKAATSLSRFASLPHGQVMTVAAEAKTGLRYEFLSPNGDGSADKLIFKIFVVPLDRLSPEAEKSFRAVVESHGGALPVKVGDKDDLKKMVALTDLQAPLMVYMDGYMHDATGTQSLCGAPECRITHTETLIFPLKAGELAVDTPVAALSLPSYSPPAKPENFVAACDFSPQGSRLPAIAINACKSRVFLTAAAAENFDLADGRPRTGEAAGKYLERIVVKGGPLLFDATPLLTFESNTFGRLIMAEGK